jgi:hypothetical protein
MWSSRTNLRRTSRLACPPGMFDDLEDFRCLPFLRPSHQCRTVAPSLLYRVPTALVLEGRHLPMLAFHQHLLQAQLHQLPLAVAGRIGLARHPSLWRYLLLWVLVRGDALSGKESQ